MSTQMNSLDQLVHDLLNHSLIMNEYRQQNKTVEANEYIKLLDGYLELTKSYRDYSNGMQDVFSEFDSCKKRN
jgi:uncharacterized FlgJ-related protein